MDKSAISSVRLREERINSGYTQEGLAKGITTQQQITYLEKGKRKLSYDMAYLIAKKLGVRVEYLMGEDDFRTEKDVMANYYKESLDYHTNLDFKFEDFLKALEIEVVAVEFEKKYRKTITVDDKLIDTDKPSYSQIVNYTIKTPTGEKQISEEEYLRFKDQVCEYTIFLAERL